MTTTKTMSVREAARRKDCTLKYIYDLLAAGKLAGARKVGKSWQIPAGAVKARLRAKKDASTR
jgi:excisionase family DNA binding protein